MKRGDREMSYPDDVARQSVARGDERDRREHGPGARSEDTGTTIKRVVIVGVTGKARALAETLESSKRPVYEIVGFLAEEDAGSPEDLNVLGSASEMFEVARDRDVDEVIIATSPRWQEELAEKISINGNCHPKIQLVPSVYETMVCHPQLERVNDLPLMTLNPDRSSISRLIKRSFDIAFSCIALVLASPLLFLSAILMKLTSPGPMLYRQARVGKDGKEFVLLKMRTMIADAEKDTGPVLSSRHDERVTFVGRILRRLKIDELPQFINVLRGDMSVVGPRPERRCFVDQFCEEIAGYNARHRVRPGITGMAQVYGYYTSDPATKLKYDLMYVYGGSFLTDLKIVALTIPAMILGT